MDRFTRWTLAAAAVAYTAYRCREELRGDDSEARRLVADPNLPQIVACEEADLVGPSEIYGCAGYLPEDHDPDRDEPNPAVFQEAGEHAWH